ncbi:virion protein [Mycobacterium phage 32HC]|uniref:Virion protein n=1 Tax=Mycobacterium phage 32HC TaxID=1445729 RepID=W8EG47_9CAUD|nr:minor tail protein [Mycobacterium phage 32HC]AHJ86306.1 virion protein [Mycobacterium phage 32HC]
MTIAAEPIPIGGRYCYIKFYAMPRNPGDPQMIAGTLTLMPDEAALTLDALIGPQGPRGLPAPFWRPEWQSTITNPADLPDELGDADAGRAWYIAGFWHIWDGDNWQVILGAIPGPPGPTPNMKMSAELVEFSGATPYGEIEVVEGGTDENPTFHLLIPGIPGPKGDNSRISESLDFHGEPLDGQTILWNAANERWEPGDASQQVVRYITLPEGSFGPAGTFSASRTVIAAPTIAGQPIAYYPKVGGHLRWKRSGLFNSAQVSVEVRYLPAGSDDAPETGALIGKALYDPSTLDAETISHIRDHWSSTADPSRAVSPESSVGRVPKDTAIDIYVILVREGGSGNYTYATKDSQLSLEMLPVS